MPLQNNPKRIYVLKVNNRSIKKKIIREKCLKLPVLTSEGRKRCSGVCIINFEHIPQHFLLTLCMYFLMGRLAKTLLTVVTKSTVPWTRFTINLKLLKFY